MVLVTCDICNREVDDSTCWVVHSPDVDISSHYNCRDEESCKAIRINALYSGLEQQNFVVPPLEELEHIPLSGLGIHDRMYYWYIHKETRNVFVKSFHTHEKKWFRANGEAAEYARRAYDYSIQQRTKYDQESHADREARERFNAFPHDDDSTDLKPLNSY